jgi:hypothetical protein
MTEQSLNLLQHWMAMVVMGRGRLRERLQAASDRHGLGAQDVIAERRGLSIHKRLSIYAQGYVLRLLECLRAEFPALRSFVGDAVFDSFAGAYLISRPSGSPSLFDFGQGFPQFLEETKPEAGSLDEDLRLLLDLPSELARVERARSEVMRAHGTEQDAHMRATLSPLDVFSEDVVLQATPTLRLLELKFPLVDFLKKFDRGEPCELGAARACLAAAGRANYRVYLEEVSPWQFAFLKACGRPTSLYEAVQVAALESGEERAAVLAELVMWLPVAVGFGFLQRLS